MRRSTFILLAVLGILILLSIFPYYWLHLGVKACQGLPTDASNCGDADFGGLGLLVLGLPIFIVGITGLAYCGLKYQLSKYHR
jgi:hypothetical protein